MKALVNTKKGLSTITFMAFMAVMMIVPEMAQAANLNTLLTDTNFMPIIKFGIGLYAAWKWFEYFSGFNPNSAFRDIVVPALMTFLAFKIDTVLTWFRLNSL